MSENALEVRGLHKSFGEVAAVRGVDLDVRVGEVCALLGPSGCGKTTMLRLIAGLERPDAGTVAVAGREVDSNGTHIAPEKRSIGMVFQDYALFPHLDVAQNVGYGLSGRAGRADRVREMLELVGLVELGARMPHELSGGQQQRVALARALAPKPEVLLLDEPFSNLDAALRARVRAEVREILRTAGATAIFVTHDREEALSLADRVAVLWQGRLIQIARPDELYRRPASPEVAAFIGDADLFPGRASGGSVACELGTLPVCPPAHGPVHVLIRPESVRLAATPDGSAVVTAHEFYGHDQVVVVRLASGRRLRARLGPRENFHPGDYVEVGVEGPVSTFPHGPTADRPRPRSGRPGG